MGINHRMSRREFCSAGAATATALGVSLASNRANRAARGRDRRRLRRRDLRARAQADRSAIAVTLVEANPTFTACPFSNEVIAGLRDSRRSSSATTRSPPTAYRRRADGDRVDPQARRVDARRRPRSATTGWCWRPASICAGTRCPATTGRGREDAARLEGRRADAVAAPPARGDGRRRPGGDLGAGQSVPLPARAYERASLIAYYLKTKKPQSKLIVLDAKELLQAAAVPERLEGAVSRHARMGVAVEGRQGHVRRSRDQDAGHRFRQTPPQVANVIPPQKAGRIAEIAGVADSTGWCPIDPVTFESKLAPNIHVIGDAASPAPCRNRPSRRTRRPRCAPPRSPRCSPAKPPDDAEADQHLLQPGRRPTTASRSPASISRRTESSSTSKVPAASARSTRRANSARAKPTMPMAGSRRSRRSVRLDARIACRALLLAGALLALPGRGRRAELAPYTIVGDAIPASLTGCAGDAARGRAIVVDAVEHLPPVPQRAISRRRNSRGPGAGSCGRRRRWSEGQLRLRIVDAARLNAATIMPPYYRVDGLHRVGPPGAASRS